MTVPAGVLEASDRTEGFLVAIREELVPLATAAALLWQLQLSLGSRRWSSLDGQFRGVVCRAEADVAACLHAGVIDWDGRQRPGLPTHHRVFTLGPSAAPEAALSVELCAAEAGVQSPWGLRLRLGGPLHPAGGMVTWAWLQAALETSCSLLSPTWAAVTTWPWPLEHLRVASPRVGALTYCTRRELIERATAHATALPFHRGQLLFPASAATTWTGVTDAEIAAVQRVVEGGHRAAAPTAANHVPPEAAPPASPWIAWASYAAGSPSGIPSVAEPAADLDGTSLLSPYAAVGKALPFAAATPAAALRSIENMPEPVRPPSAQGDDLDETAPLGIRTLADPSPVLPWVDAQRFRTWTLETYASLCAELAEQPESAVETGRRYRVEEHEAMRQLNLEFAERFRSEPGLLPRWQQLVEAYRLELRSRRHR